MISCPDNLSHRLLNFAKEEKINQLHEDTIQHFKKSVELKENIEHKYFDTKIIHEEIENLSKLIEQLYNVIIFYDGKLNSTQLSDIKQQIKNYDEKYNYSIETLISFIQNLSSCFDIKDNYSKENITKFII